jgi:hypothetical protein
MKTGEKRTISLKFMQKRSRKRRTKEGATPKQAPIGPKLSFPEGKKLYAV